MQGCILVTGPTKSGKSEWAEQLAAQCSEQVLYVATSQVDGTDADWQARVARHRQRRPVAWQTLEVPHDLAAALRAAPSEDCWLVDSLGTWLANCLEQTDEEWQATVEDLLKAIAIFPNMLILVAEETGWGVVPAYPLGRKFRDRLGDLTRRIGAIADTTYLVVAGFAISLNESGILVSSGADSRPD